MIQQQITLWSDRCLFLVSQIKYEIAIFASIWVLLVAVLLLWRLWKFTVSPILHPYEPKELPYWIPYLGHAIQYVKNGQGLLTYGRNYFKNTREPFALTLGGEKLFILTSPEDVATAYKNATHLTFDHVVYELSLTFGVSRSAMDKACQKPTKENNILSQKLQIENPHLKSLTQLNSDFYKQQLHPGEKFDVIQQKFLSCIDKSMRLENLATPYGLSSTREEKIISLQGWCQDILLKAGTEAFFGQKILQMDPDLLRNFLDFDAENWKLWYKWPQAEEMHAAKNKITKTLQEYLNMPKDLRLDAAWLVQTMEDTQKAIGMGEQDIATVLTMVYFVVNTNTYKVCFWVMAHIVHSSSLYETIRRETAPAILSNGEIDNQYLHSSCPHLESLFNEVLRFASASSSIRKVVSPTIIGGKKLPTGARVMFPFRQLHYNEDAYGEDVMSFNPDRFLQGKNLPRSSSYRPFGGGTSYCPGRFIARQEVYYVAVFMLHRFKIRVLDRPGSKDKPVFPRMDEWRPTTGLMSPVSGDDVLIGVKQL